MSGQTIDEPVLAALLRYWDAKRADGPMPARHAIDPLEMGGGLLPHLMLCDLYDRGTRVRFRLVGTTVVRRFGFDPTGRFLADQPRSSYFDLMGALHRVLYCERAPLYSESVFCWGARRRLEARHLLLPLTNGGPDPAIALLGISFASDTPFPPLLRSLNTIAQYCETHRSVVSLTAPRAWQAQRGRNVA